MKKQFQTLLFLSIFLFTFTSCYRSFYKSNSSTSINNEKAHLALRNNDKYFIFHHNNKIEEMSNLILADSSFEADLNEIKQKAHLSYLTPKENSSNRYLQKDQKYVLKEVHIYAVANYTQKDFQHISFSAKDISRIDIYTKDNARTINNYMISTTSLVFSITAFLFALFSGPLITLNYPFF